MPGKCTTPEEVKGAFYDMNLEISYDDNSAFNNEFGNLAR